MKTFVLVLLSALSLHASTVQTTVTLLSVNGTINNSVFTGPYYIALGPENVQYSVFCDDFSGAAEIGQTYNATVHSGDDLVNVLWPIQDYKTMFAILDLEQQAGLSGGQSALNDPLWQLAIWAVEGSYPVTLDIQSVLNQANTLLIDMSLFSVIDGPPGQQEFITEGVVPSVPEPNTLWMLSIALYLAGAGLYGKKFVR